MTPPIQLYARPTGMLQWACPACGELFGVHRVPWRRARVRCRQCFRTYRIGIGLQPPNDRLPPFNAIAAGLWDGATSNRLGTTAGTPAVGRYTGHLDWICPTCTTLQSSTIDRTFGLVDCSSCMAQFSTYLIIYKAPRHRSITSPIDWIPEQLIHETQKTHASPYHPFSPSAISQGDGAAS